MPPVEELDVTQINLPPSATTVFNLRSHIPVSAATRERLMGQWAAAWRSRGLPAPVMFVTDPTFRLEAITDAELVKHGMRRMSVVEKREVAAVAAQEGD